MLATASVLCNAPPVGYCTKMKGSMLHVSISCTSISNVELNFVSHPLFRAIHYRFFGLQLKKPEGTTAFSSLPTAAESPDLAQLATIVVEPTFLHHVFLD